MPSQSAVIMASVKTPERWLVKVVLLVKQQTIQSLITKINKL